MPEVKYGLSREGFKRKRLPEILSDMASRFSDALGVPVETGANSVLGQLFGVIGYEISDLWQLGEETYHAMYPSTASGVSLSNAAGIAGITAITAEYTTLTATCTGTDGTVIPYNSRIQSSQDASKSFYSIDSSSYIDAGMASGAEISLASAPAAGTRYSLTIDGKEAEYTAADGDTQAVVLTGLAAAISDTNLTTSVVNDVLRIAEINPLTTFSIAAGSGTALTRVSSPVRFRCETVGAVNPSLGEVNQIITPVAGWSSVSNEAAAVVGREAESDTALRQRWSGALYERSSAMVESVQSDVMQNVDGVKNAIVYENTSDVTDEFGRPPHSIEAVVDGGDEGEVALHIWQKKAAGIDTYGDVSEIIYDSQGASHEIHFNRPEQIKVWMKIIVSANPDETMPAAALQEIKDAVLAKGQTQTVGQDVILQRYFSEIFRATSGVGYISLTAATGDSPGTYSTENISINPRQIAVFDAARIEVSKGD